MRQKTILFDIDGTLVKPFHPVFIESTYYSLGKHLNKRISNYIRPNLSGRTDKNIIKILAEEYNIKLNKTDYQMIYELTREFILEKYPSDYKNWIIDHVEDLLVNLSHYHLGILTGNNEFKSLLKLELLGIKQYFSFIISGGEHQRRTTLAKKALQNHIATGNDQIYIVGDTPNDINCAKYIGAVSIAMTTGEHDYFSLKKHNPDYIFTNHLELKNFFLSFDKVNQ